MTDGGTSTHLAIDLGAESGRGRLGWLDGGRLEVEDVGRFATAQVPLPLGPV